MWLQRTHVATIPYKTIIDINKLCTKNPTSKITIPPLETLFLVESSSSIIIHRHHGNTKERGKLLQYLNIGDHLCIQGYFLSRWTRPSQATRPRLCGFFFLEFSPWSRSRDAINFIWCSRRRGTSPPTIIHTPTPNTTTDGGCDRHPWEYLTPTTTHKSRCVYCPTWWRRKAGIYCMPVPGWLCISSRSWARCMHERFRTSASIQSIAYCS
jgi:hypothetical protein